MRRLLSAMATVAVLGFAAGTWAQDESGAPKQEPVADQQADLEQITGKVLKASKEQVIIEYEGAAVPLLVSKDTRIQGATTVRSLEEGQEVRASFELKDNQNQLKSLTVMPAGAGEKSKTDEPQKSDQKSQDETY